MPRLVDDLLGWLSGTEAHPLIAFFADALRAGVHPSLQRRQWARRAPGETLILSRWQPILAYLPVETVIRSRQDAYSRVLGEADEAADCSGFILFMLDALATALRRRSRTGLR